MSVAEFMKKVIFPVGIAVFLCTLFYPLCVENGECDYLKLWIVVGIPFGIHRMFLWIVPKGFDLGGTVGMVAMNLLVGGMIGGVVLIWRLIMSVFYVVQCVGKGFLRLIGKCKAV